MVMSHTRTLRPLAEIVANPAQHGFNFLEEELQEHGASLSKEIDELQKQLITSNWVITDKTERLLFSKIEEELKQFINIFNTYENKIGAELLQKVLFNLSELKLTC